MDKKRIGVFTGGGDCAGLNPAIKWVVKTAVDDRLQQTRKVQYEVVGIRDGWKGLVHPEGDEDAPGSRIYPLTEEMVRTWDRYGGTNLGTSRTNPYDPKKDRSKIVLENLKRYEIDYLVAIGGEDTLGVAEKLSREGVKIVGIPKTIDKDLSGTDYTLGFETALNVITEEIDRLRTTAGSHRRIFVVETMGRHAGWLALEGGESSGAYIILIPEFEFEIDRVNELSSRGEEREPVTRLLLSPKERNLWDNLSSQKIKRSMALVTSPWEESANSWQTKSLVLRNLRPGASH